MDAIAPYNQTRSGGPVAGRPSAEAPSMVRQLDQLYSRLSECHEVASRIEQGCMRLTGPRPAEAQTAPGSRDKEQRDNIEARMRTLQDIVDALNSRLNGVSALLDVTV